MTDCQTGLYNKTQLYIVYLKPILKIRYSLKFKAWKKDLTCKH